MIADGFFSVAYDEDRHFTAVSQILDTLVSIPPVYD
jgi:hypothetical protein